jgi:hypothetical protein
MIKAAYLGVVSPNRFMEHATRQALHPEHLELSAYSRMVLSFDLLNHPTLDYPIF